MTRPGIELFVPGLSFLSRYFVQNLTPLRISVYLNADSHDENTDSRVRPLPG